MKGNAFVRIIRFLFGSSKTGASEVQDVGLAKKLRFQRKTDVGMVRIFFAVLIVSSVLAMIPSFRSSYSEIEKRELTKFPKFTAKSLFSGDYFDGINLWFSDTFPLRDKFITLNTYMTGTFGNDNVQIHGKIDESDDIPDVPPEKPQKDQSQNEDSSREDKNENSSSDTGGTQSNSQPDKPAVEKLGAILVIDNAGYEYYNFGLETANKYIANINRAADKLQGKAKVYDIVIPTSMAIVPPDDIVKGVNSSDQKKAIDYMYNGFNSNVSAVDIYPTLREHRSEYLYFRTDHHWTALGAYYAYSDLMGAMSKKPAALSDFIEHKFEGYLGSFYSKAGKPQKMADTPDTVYAYEPKQFNTIVTTLDTGQVVNKKIISNGDSMSQGSKYLAFVTGDRPYGVMTNPEINDGSACVVIKESFGNCFVPFLTQNYQYVYVIDYRYFYKIDSRNLEKFVEDTMAQDVIFINNISATRNKSLVNSIAALVGE